MKSKALSMKKMYLLAGGYIEYKYNRKMDFGQETIDAANKDLAELNRFLRFVWDHRNDENN